MIRLAGFIEFPLANRHSVTVQQLCRHNSLNLGQRVQRTRSVASQILLLIDEATGSEFPVPPLSNCAPDSDADDDGEQTNEERNTDTNEENDDRLVNVEPPDEPVLRLIGGLVRPFFVRHSGLFLHQDLERRNCRLFRLSTVLDQHNELESLQVTRGKPSSLFRRRYFSAYRIDFETSFLVAVSQAENQSCVLSEVGVSRADRREDLSRRRTSRQANQLTVKGRELDKRRIVVSVCYVDCHIGS